MKISQIIFIVTVFSIFILAKNDIGKYFYKSNKYFEYIDLREDNTFVYYCKQEFLSYEIKGNYNIIGDSLTLDSNPQKDRIIVQERSKGSLNKNIIFVSDKRGEAIHYNLYLILDNNKELELVDQWKASIVKNHKIKGFYIIDSKGLKSPTYVINGKFSNNFKVLFETKRVFENEKWFLNSKKIKPRGLDGKFQNYYLEMDNIR